MRQTIIVIVLVTGILAAFLGYCTVLIDWAQDIKTGVYQINRIEGFVETANLFLYTYLAIRFVRSRIKFS
jgi:hypothetical protein